MVAALIPVKSLYFVAEIGQRVAALSKETEWTVFQVFLVLVF